MAWKGGWMKALLGFFSGLILFLLGCGADAPVQPNVLLFTLDTLRADALGCYGEAREHTPALDSLAREGVLFEDAICQIPATLTSHTAILTGRHPKTTGVRFAKVPVPPAEQTLAERFALARYDTAAFLSSLVLAPEFGLDQGFKNYDLGSMRSGEHTGAPERRAQETIDAALAFLQTERDRPFFLWIHLYDPHTPYDAPAPFGGSFDPGYQGPLRGTVAEITRLNAAKGQGATPRDLEHLRALYLEEVASMDSHIQRVLNLLRERQILDQTIVAAIADHGEALGEKGHFFHGTELYNPSVQIPFLLRYPKSIPAGLRVKPFVQSVDLYPTLLELAGLPANPAIDGSSLLPLIQEAGAGYASHPGYMETEADTVSEANKLYGLRTDEYKFIYNQAHRRSETPLGLMTEIPLKGPAAILLRLKGDASVRLMAHIRYRTEELYTSRDLQALAACPTTMIHAETTGIEPIHQEAMQQDTFIPTPEGWRLQMTPDLYRIALAYGQANGWPTRWMVVEGVGIDASIPHEQTEAQFVVDQVELYAPTLRFPDSPRFRNPFWVIEDFEDAASPGLVDAHSGPAHQVETAWQTEPIFNGQRQQHIKITFSPDESAPDVNEFYHIGEDPSETQNLHLEAAAIARDCRFLLRQWMEAPTGAAAVQPLSPAQSQALQNLGYMQ